MKEGDYLQRGQVYPAEVELIDLPAVTDKFNVSEHIGDIVAKVMADLSDVGAHSDPGLAPGSEGLIRLGARMWKSGTTRPW